MVIGIYRTAYHTGMDSMNLIISVLLTAVFFIPGFLGAFFYFKRGQVKRKLKSVQHAHYKPKVSVILPFKGEDYNFGETIKALLSQEYDGEYEVVFVTSDTESTAVDLVKQYTKDSKIAKLITVSQEKDSIHRGDKVNSMLNGILNTSSTSEVYLFIDSDIVPHKKWIEKMTRPLYFKKCGLSSGGAWIVSEKSSFLSLVTRYWDFLATTYVTFPVTSFARGFSFAIRKEVFEHIGIRDIWANAYHDNFPISKVVKMNGFQIYYAPDCLVTEGFDIKGFDWVKWVKRQTINTKVNFRHLFLISFIFVSVPGLIGGLGFLTCVYLYAFCGFMSPIIFLFLVWPIIHFVTAFIVVSAVYSDRKIYPDFSNKMTDKLKLTLFSIVILLYYCSAVWALFSSKMEWRNQLYKTKSPFTTEIKDIENE